MYHNFLIYSSADGHLGCFLCICVICCDVYIFISNFVDLLILPLFLNESGYWFVNLIYILKEPAFSFVDFCYGLLLRSFNGPEPGGSESTVRK